MIRTLSLLAVLAHAAVPTLAHADTLYGCPLDGGAGDRIDRGFYIFPYAGTSLETVSLTFYPDPVPGAFTVSLTVHEETYDGAVLGTQQVTFTETGGTFTFDFGSIPVTQWSTLAFVQQILGAPEGANVFYDIGPCGINPFCGQCEGVVETVGTDPPLSSDRRHGVGLTVTGSTSVAVERGSWGQVKALYR